MATNAGRRKPILARLTVLPLARADVDRATPNMVASTGLGRDDSFHINSNLYPVYDSSKDKSEPRRPLRTARSGTVRCCTAEVFTLA